MDLHWIAGGVVLLILAAISAYRDAIESDGATRFRAMREDGSTTRDAQQ
jgi:hypothetical protein